MTVPTFRLLSRPYPCDAKICLALREPRIEPLPCATCQPLLQEDNNCE